MASTEQLMGGGGPKYVQMPAESSSPPSELTPMISTFLSFDQPNNPHDESNRIFDELPRASIIQVSRPDAGDISPVQLTYTIEFQYKEFKWQLVKKASQVFYLHFALKKRKFIEEMHEKQEQVKDWLQNLGLGDHAPVMQDDEEPDDETVPLRNDDILRKRDVPSSAALPVIRPALGRQHSMSDRAKGAMQEYLNHFLSNIDIVNSQEVCKFLEVSKLSFSPEYGPKLKEDYILVKHLPMILDSAENGKCCSCQWFCCCRDNWQKVWAVLKPGFLAFLKDPFEPKPLDIIVFDVLPASDGNGEGRVSLAKEVSDHNPLRHYFRVTCGTRSIKLRTKSTAKVKDWVAAINDAGLRPPEGWCHPHRFGSFAPPRGLIEDSSQAQWFVDGRAAFEAIALAIEEAKSEIFICGWWLCPELYLRRPFNFHSSSRLDFLLESKAKQGIQVVYILLYKEVSLALKINSVHSKRKLLGIHENIRVLRYPDHFSTGVYLWYAFHHCYVLVMINGLSSHVMQSSSEVPNKEWWEIQERGGQVVPADEIGQVGPRVSCRCQIIRSVSQWSAGTSQIEESIHNAYCSLIDRADHYVYIENQFFISGLSGDEIIQNRVLEALYRRIVRAVDEKKCFRVIIVIPLLPGFQGGVDDSGAASVRAIMHWQYRTICRGNSSILHNLYNLVGPRMYDYISFYGLRAYGKLFNDGPVATSQVYVHSKIMIVDDHTTLISSANINDRSLLGSRDSEIGVLIEDKEFVDSWIGGKSWRAGRFALSLRLSLWSEHIGLHAGEVDQIRDPVADSTYKDIWMATAKTNTMIYQDVFSCIPNDLIHTRASLRQSMSFWREKIGHTTTDLGIAPEKLETFQNGDITGTDPMERLKSVKGHLVSFPLDFMCKEDLRPVFNESEYYASPQVFH
ncbi:Phospholipase D p1 [Striga hermonthica]|uniref:Phospholipase n=1 Tax=Striga hermonthica TaxID=68872 RepID=A0A9N7RBS5_STRHE|nr:Phospholipase D p1 [Striga hermonthica]